MKMRSVVYGKRTIHYTIQEKENLKSHYVIVERETGVTLKGKAVPPEKADKLVLNRARWILDKLELVSTIPDQDIVTGSRIQYLGKKYYTEVLLSKELEAVAIAFTHSKFIITIHPEKHTQESIKQALDEFYRQKAKEKITPRVKKLSAYNGFPFTGLRFLKLAKRWGSCTPLNTIIINTEAIKLPFTLIDYLILHELAHTRVKSHSKEFWAELSMHCVNWKELDEQMQGWKM